MQPKGHLIAIGGLSGSGKSTLARTLVEQFNAAGRPAILVSNDVIRKQMWGISLHETLPPEAYEMAFTMKVYDEVDRLIAEGLRDGKIVVVDGLFVGEKKRQRLEMDAQNARADFTGMWIDAPVSVMKQRAEARKGTGDPSDAGADMVITQLRFKKGEIAWPRINGGGTKEETWAQALSVLQKAGFDFGSSCGPKQKGLGPTP